MAKRIKKYKNMYYKTLFYGKYCGCFSRIIHELILNGDDNFKSTDLPNMLELLTKYHNKLYKNLVELEYAFE